MPTPNFSKLETAPFKRISNSTNNKQTNSDTIVLLVFCFYFDSTVDYQSKRKIWKYEIDCSNLILKLTLKNFTKRNNCFFFNHCSSFWFELKGGTLLWWKPGSNPGGDKISQRGSRCANSKTRACGKTLHTGRKMWLRKSTGGLIGGGGGT